MKRTVPILFVLLLSCGEKRYAPQECQSLELTVPQRCFGGNITTGKYVGDLKCWPFSKPQRMRGVWVISMEASVFAPNATAITSTAPPDLAWLKTDLSRSSERIAAGRGEGDRAYLIEFSGRRSLCDGNFGHHGSYGREVIVDRFYSIRRLALPTS